jgi:hypothetical protein
VPQNAEDYQLPTASAIRSPKRSSTSTPYSPRAANQRQTFSQSRALREAGRRAAVVGTDEFEHQLGPGQLHGVRDGRAGEPE